MIDWDYEHSRCWTQPESVAPGAAAGSPLALEALREALAALAHEQWSGWMRHMFSKCQWDRAMLIVPAVWEARWKRQMDTPYAQLSEAEKESDRAEADRVLARLRAGRHA